MLIDTHCHLDFPEIAADMGGVMERARAAGVGRMITISTRVKKYEVYQALAEQNANVWFTVGTHPHQAHEEPDVSVADLKALASHPRCIGIGEAGLDYHYDKSPRDVAAKVFRAHIAAARETGLPLVIHSREADEDMAAILRDEMGKGRFNALLHCFTSSRELAQTAIELGLYVSFSGVLTFKNSQALREIAADMPIDRVLVETDAPFLAPMPHRGKPNQPAYVAETNKILGAIKGLTPEEIASKTTANALRIFDKMPKGVE
jgi:TatD DNase family protein